MEEGDFDRIRNRWFQIFDFLIIHHPLYFRENLRDFAEILLEL